MMTLRHILRSASAGAVLLAAAVAAPHSAALAEAQPVASSAQAGDAPPFERRASYDISLGGFQVAEAKLRVQWKEDDYIATFELVSDGLLDWFYSATIKTEASGAFTPEGRTTPELFTFRSKFDERPQDVDVAYSEAGPSEVRAEPPFKPRPWQLAPEEQIDTLDPISAIVRLMHPRTGIDVCDRSVDIFDGRRRYELALVEELERSEEDGYVKIECIAVWRRLAGFKPKYMRLPPNEFILRVHVYEDGVIWPVRAWAETDYGAVVAVLD